MLLPKGLTPHSLNNACQKQLSLQSTTQPKPSVGSTLASLVPITRLYCAIYALPHTTPLIPAAVLVCTLPPAPLRRHTLRIGSQHVYTSSEQHCGQRYIYTEVPRAGFSAGHTLPPHQTQQGDSLSPLGCQCPEQHLLITNHF